MNIHIYYDNSFKVITKSISNGPNIDQYCRAALVVYRISGPGPAIYSIIKNRYDIKYPASHNLSENELKKYLLELKLKTL